MSLHVQCRYIHRPAGPGLNAILPTVLPCCLSPFRQLMADVGWCTPCRPLSKCNKFGKLWSNTLEGLTAIEAATEVSILGAATGVTFWRPKPAIGYVALGDCITSGSMQPAFQVSHKYIYVRPLKVKCTSASNSSRHHEYQRSCLTCSPMFAVVKVSNESLCRSLQVCVVFCHERHPL